MSIMDKKKLILRAEELRVLIIFLLCKTIAYFLPKSDIWLISERGHEARDNAYVFFCYLCKYHPEVKARYVISYGSKDVDRFSDKSKLINYGSFSHYLLLCRASYLISTHIMGYTPWMDFFCTLDRKYNIFSRQKRIFLQHGITQNNLPMLKGDQVNLDLFCCGAKEEYDYIKNEFGHKEGVVQYTGFCRYDNLFDYQNKRQILIMPTWRMYIRDQKFSNTEYFKTWSSVLSDSRIGALLKQHDYNLLFYPHYEVQKHIEDFQNLKLADNVSIADFEYDVQTLLKESELLITDYSSVFFDFAYMKKPVILFQFDLSEFIKRHYSKGYFEESSIGVKVTNLEALIDEIENQIKVGMKPKEEHLKYVEKFFEYNDTRNCERTYNIIKSL